MAGNRLTNRVEALERSDGGIFGGPAAWIICEEGETSEQARARYEAEHGLIGDRMAIVWCPVADPVHPCA